MDRKSQVALFFIILSSFLFVPGQTFSQGEVSPDEELYFFENDGVKGEDDSFVEEGKFTSSFTYTWEKPNYDYKEFQVEVYRDEKLEDLIFERRTTSSSIDIEVSEDLYIRIAVVSKDGELTDFSNVSKISYNKQDLELISPRNEERILGGGQEIAVKFSWDYRGAGTCRMQVFDNPDSSPASQKKINSEELTLNLSPGKYWWNVVCKKEESIISSKKEIFYAGKPDKIRVLWRKERNADYYRVAFYNKKKNGKKVYLKTKSNRLILPKKIDLNSLYARLKIYNNKAISNWSDELLVNKDAGKVDDLIRLDFKWKKKRFKKRKNKYSLSMFYSVSQGTFNETGISGTKLIQEQNSPATLGLAGLRRLSGGKSLSGSVYFSYLTAAKVKGDSATQVVPLEVGLNTYYNIPTSLGFTYYGGVDLEKFSTFNTDELTTSNLNLEFYSQFLTYLTVGITKGFSLFERNSFIKLSGSYSVLSLGDKNPINNEVYNGYKFILYFNMQIAGNWSGHAFYKHHFLSDAGDQTVSRYGFGLGYSFF